MKVGFLGMGVMGMPMAKNGEKGRMRDSGL